MCINHVTVKTESAVHDKRTTLLDAATGGVDAGHYLFLTFLFLGDSSGLAFYAWCQAISSYLCPVFMYLKANRYASEVRTQSTPDLYLSVVF